MITSATTAMIHQKPPGNVLVVSVVVVTAVPVTVALSLGLPVVGPGVVAVPCVEGCAVVCALASVPAVAVGAGVVVGF
jgi:hypothetical protein